MKTNKLKPANIKAKTKFYFWLMSIGADLQSFDPANLQIHEIPPRQKSSFKKRAAEIKAKFNYNFKMREQDFIADFPNLENLTFNRKIA